MDKNDLKWILNGLNGNHTLVIHQMIQNQTKPNNTKIDITQIFLKLQVPDLAW